MDKQNVTLKTQTLEDIGIGGLIYKPCQIGEWWVMPAGLYKGTIPPEIYQKYEDFKKLNLPVLGYLIADDMREVLIKRAKDAQEALEREKKAEQERYRQLIYQQQLAESERQRRWQEGQQASYRRQQAEQEAEQAAKVALLAIGGLAAVGLVVVTGGAALLLFGLMGAFITGCTYDPILIAVLPPDKDYPRGRWVCVGAWWGA